MFLAGKRDGKIKVRACADGRDQHGKTEKEEVTSPIVAIVIIFITLDIDAHEGRDVATIDITGAFIHAYSDEHIIIVLKGNIALLMCHVAPKLYRKYIIFNKRGQTCYICEKILKDLYRLLRSALPFYRKLVKDLHKYGLEMNPYNPCVFNGTNNGKQLTVTFHVDKLKVSHMYLFYMTLFVCSLSTIYANKLVVHREKVHDCLGINFDFS